MYGGKLVEVGAVRDIFKEPMHPYTRLLISSLASLDVKGVLRGIPGAPPSLLNPPSGCVFHPRCPNVMARCSLEVPMPQAAGGRPDRSVACHLYD
jgi:oligopeptide/dipeptide ABC transporter ATP-binding protein